MKRSSFIRKIIVLFTLAATIFVAPMPVAQAGTGELMRGNRWMLRYSNTQGEGERSFTYGTGSGDELAVVGDWDGSGTDTPGFVRIDRQTDTLTWYLRNSNSTGFATFDFTYGAQGDIPVVGDWDGDGVDTPGVVRSSQDGRLMWFLRNSNSTGFPALRFFYGELGDTPVVGDWNGIGNDAPGYVRAESEEDFV